jgi:hypothetical protein
MVSKKAGQSCGKGPVNLAPALAKVLLRKTVPSLEQAHANK